VEQLTINSQQYKNC